MRTPINIASVGLYMHEKYLIENDFLDDDSKELLADIKNAIVVALDTLNEVLHYEKLYSKLMVLEKSLHKPAEFVLSTLKLFQVPAQNNGINLILPVEKEDAFAVYLKDKRVSIDVYKMGQVMRNFISNALKFTPSGGTIEVKIQCGNIQELQSVEHFQKDKLDSQLTPNQLFDSSSLDPWVEIAVVDNGIGIEIENQHRVFTEIVQFNANANQNGNGSGLGMCISKGIVELHGGKVALYSEGIGKGCRFSIFLPLFGEDGLHVEMSKRKTNKFSYQIFSLI